MTQDPWQSELEYRRFWRDMPSERKGAIIAELLNLVAAKGDFPPKEDMFPGWNSFARNKRPDAGSA